MSPQYTDKVIIGDWYNVADDIRQTNFLLEDTMYTIRECYWKDSGAWQVTFDPSVEEGLTTGQYIRKMKQNYKAVQVLLFHGYVISTSYDGFTSIWEKKIDL